MSTTVHVSGISSQTSDKEIRDFFSFCGKISNLSVTPTEGDEKSATVTFEKETAAKTALLLDNTQLGPAQVHVTSAASLDDLAGKPPAEGDAGEGLRQEDKPRARIFAEYLAHGYQIGDKVIEKGLQLDQQHGISARFTNVLKDFDAKFHATDKAKAVDQQYAVTDKVQAGWASLNSYFEKAMGTPTGQKLRRFYEQGNKQVVDVHNEARHLADLKKSEKNKPEPVAEGSDRTKCNCGSESGKCTCAPGTCACSDCAKNPEVESGVDKEQAEMEQVPGTDRTKCNCGSSAEKCPCPPGKCACASCAKNPDA